VKDKEDGFLRWEALLAVLKTDDERNSYNT
jgi:hypothetical protein